MKSLAQIINGRLIAKTIRKEIKRDVAYIKDEYKIQPSLTVILVGERQDSATYVRMKSKAAKEVNIRASDIKFPSSVSEVELIETIKELNSDTNVNAILVQLPLPNHINEAKVLETIDVSKDVDGFSASNVGHLCLRGRGLPKAVACTPAGIIELLKRSVPKDYDFAGKHAIVVGRSNIVGMPVSHLLLSLDCTVTICHSKTKNIEEQVGRADIIIAAVGRTEYIKGTWIKNGAIVIDVGINAVKDSSKKSGYRLVGDVEFETAKQKASLITPVPGGVGPMTIAMLLLNTVNLTKTQHSLEKTSKKRKLSPP